MGFPHGMGSHHMMGYGNLSMVWIVLIAVLIFTIFLLTHKLMQHNKQLRGHKAEEGALTILMERYAKGELTEEEFNRKKGILTK